MSDWMFGDPGTGDAGIGDDTGFEWTPPPPEISPYIDELADIFDTLATQDSGGGGYPGGPTPDGFTPHEDGTGRFMYDSEGRMLINPNYAEWLNHEDQEIDWGGVTLDMLQVIGGAHGWLSVGALRQMIGWGIAGGAEYLDHRYPDSGN